LALELTKVMTSKECTWVVSKRVVALTMMLSLLGICGGTLYSTSSLAVLSFWNASPNMPRGVVRCRWAVDSPVNRHVEINVTSVNLPSISNDSCVTDHLEIRNHPLVRRFSPRILCFSAKWWRFGGNALVSTNAVALH